MTSLFWRRLKGHGNEADFQAVPEVGFEFVEIFVIEKRLSDSPSRGVVDSPTRRIGESMLLPYVSKNVLHLFQYKKAF
jgi:hypothetical protein